MKRILAAFFLMALLSGSAFANNARDYLPLPPDTFFLALYYNHISGSDVYSDGNKVATSADFEGNLSIIRPVYFTQLGSFTIDPQFLLPVGELSFDIGGNHMSSSGIGDLTLAATIWFVNNQEDKFIFAYTPFLTLPSGEYERESGINLGAHRWATKHELCVAKGFGDKTWLEVSSYTQFYSDNKDALGLDGSKVTSEKDPTFGAEAHLSYDFTKQFFGALNYIYTFGGETTLDDEEMDDSLSTHNLGVTFAYMLTPNMQLMTDFNTDLYVENGVKTTTAMVRLGFIF